MKRVMKMTRILAAVAVLALTILSVISVPAIAQERTTMTYRFYTDANENGRYDLGDPPVDPWHSEHGGHCYMVRNLDNGVCLDTLDTLHFCPQGSVGVLKVRTGCTYEWVRRVPGDETVMGNIAVGGDEAEVYLPEWPSVPETLVVDEAIFRTYLPVIR